MKQHVSYLVGCIIMMLATSSLAQDQPVLHDRAFINITTDPSPALVVLQGKPKSVLHETPAQLELSPSNFFKIQLMRKGYERSGGHIGFRRMGTDSLHTFIFKTDRLSALGRSLIFPGWGQRYASYGKKGFWFGTFTLGSAVATGYAHYLYESKNDDLAKAERLWRQETILSRKNQLWQTWGLKFIKTEQYYQQRRIWSGLTGYFYAVNLIDALALTPMFSGQLDGQGGVHFNMAKKTPFKAVLRTTLIPGWGHYYVGERSKAWLYGLLCAAGTGVALTYYADYQTQVTRYDLSQDFYELVTSQGRSITDLRTAYEAVLDEERKADEDYRRFQWAAGVTAGIWALNVIDMMFSFRSDEILSGQYFTGTESDDSLRLSTHFDGSVAGLALNFKF